MSGVAGSAKRPFRRRVQDVTPSSIPAPRAGAAAWPRQRVRLRTRPLPPPVDLGPGVEAWQAACDDCTFTAVTPSRPELVLAVRQHSLVSRHPAPALSALFVVPHGSQRKNAVSRLTLHIEVRAT